jgi:hypothetical protein
MFQIKDSSEPENKIDIPTIISLIHCAIIRYKKNSRTR